MYYNLYNNLLVKIKNRPFCGLFINFKKIRDVFALCAQYIPLFAETRCEKLWVALLAALLHSTTTNDLASRKILTSRQEP